MARDFTGDAGRLVTERDRPDRDFGGDHAAEIGGDGGIVIARNPDPVAPRLQRAKRVAVVGRQPRMRLAIVKEIAESAITTCGSCRAITRARRLRVASVS